MMNVQHISLDGDWQLAYAPESRFRIEHPNDLDTTGMEVVPARVPGNVELDLVRAGRLPDPFYADHIRQLRPLEFYEWWYTREIDLGLEKDDCRPGSGWDLVFAGLDTLATV
jgi:beta-mannosidase